ncbi:MAG: hypothetical protein A2V81_03795 [Candidatus Abawacabacteria bacterium RBG_16_42_10]|uniref:PIN domain-containing protein n=1 Tax=Candidatus Abawacabacteria bacterium RBG_16_42_10 TaxID=1817814 RepID=A0A1F4XK19_9BACT|nr:MAG: hypothetical protein A2V81_03795 [Candidatus Abawacabacteria bacterium RBG_16_42_10]
MIIVDSNVWIADFFADDGLHENARRTLELLTEGILLPLCVLQEVVGFVQNRMGKREANKILHILTTSTHVEILIDDREEWQAIFCLYLSNHSNKLSFVDHYLLYASEKYPVVTFDKALAKRIKM